MIHKPAAWPPHLGGYTLCQQALIAYYDYAKDHDPLFALLPEVWLHWDPVSRRQRGEDAFLDQRMDFLMLLPGLRRVVLEVDGEQHYATSSRQPSPRIYSETTRGDRDLRLTGYEVYRFSGYELGEDRGMQRPQSSCVGSSDLLVQQGFADASAAMAVGSTCR